jgi:plasmid stabilization system protein ParE
MKRLRWLRQSMRNIKTVVFSKKATYRLTKITDFIYTQTQSESMTLAYMSRLKEYIRDILIHFPESGRKCEEYGKGIRKLVYQGYSILYRLNEPKERVEIVNIFRENLP